MALQPFVEPWPLFHFLDPIHSQATTYTKNSTDTE
jgi:hypothetical protein